MIALIESILGSKLGRIAAEVLFGLLIVGCFVLHFEHKGAQSELAKVQAVSSQAVAKATAQAQKDASKYTAAQDANKGKTDEALKRVGDLQSQLASSVRDFDAYRHAHPDVPRTGSVATAALSGECGSEDCGAVVERLALRGNELAGSLGQLSADLQSCQRDRDALTGEPR